MNRKFDGSFNKKLPLSGWDWIMGHLGAWSVKFPMMRCTPAWSIFVVFRFRSGENSEKATFEYLDYLIRWSCVGLLFSIRLIVIGGYDSQCTHQGFTT